LLSASDSDFNVAVSERQLRLFPHSKPLLNRFGEGFFTAAPRSPGVYVMTGVSGEILYVGQSKNLRARLATYRNANPEHLPRRIIRMVHLVASITWEKCQTQGLARVRENELLRLHRPRFNRMNTYPQAYCFLALRWDGSRVELSLSRAATESACEYGAFKSGAVYAYVALLRLLWCATAGSRSVSEYPRQLLTGKAPKMFSFQPARGGWQDAELLVRLLHEYFAGKASLLLEWFRAAIRTDASSLFHENLIKSDLELLQGFYEHGPKRLHRLKRIEGRGEELVRQDELDDLIALGTVGKDEA